MQTTPNNLAWIPKLGDSGWEVEWCIYIHVVDGEREPDLDKYRKRYFKRKSEAERFAREIFPDDLNGTVQITAFRIEPLSEDWPHGQTIQYATDSFWYEGE